MAESLAKLGFGTLLQRSDGASPPVYTTLAEAFDIGEFGETVSQVEVTHHESPNKTREFISGLKEGDEFSVALNYLPTNATQDQTTGIISVFQAGSVDVYRLVAPDNDVIFQAKLTVLHWGVAFNLDDRQVLNVNFKISGAITFPTP